METTKYPYSINYSLASILVMLILMLLLFQNVVRGNNTLGWVVYGVFVVAFIGFTLLILLKRLMPAIKGKSALELNEQCLVDYIRNITIDWKDIKEIDMIRSRSSSIILLKLKWESDYGSEIDIPLRFVKGKDAEIYNAVLAYFEEGSGDILL